MPSWNEENVLRRRQKILEERNLLSTIADPGDEGTITPDAQAVRNVCNLTSAGAETRVLGVPSFAGQMLIIVAADVSAGDIVITHTDTFDGSNNTATFGDDGDSIVLVAAGTTAATWRSIANGGVALSSV